jgi:hypothetical protein
MLDAPLTAAPAPFGSAAHGAGDGRPLSTFLITDIEGSTRLWEERAAAMAGALAMHDVLPRAAVEGRGGRVIKTTRGRRPRRLRRPGRWALGGAGWPAVLGDRDERLGLAARSDLGHALRRGGHLMEAMAIYRETIGGWIHLGHRGAVANQLENIAYVAVETDQPERDARLLGAAVAIRAAAEAPMAMEERPEFDSFVERLRSVLSADVFTAEWDAGGRLSLAEAISLARAA